MKIYVNKFNPANNTDCLILPIYQDKQQPLITAEFNSIHNNFLDNLLKNKDITGKFGEIKWLYNLVPHFPRILLVGVGDPDALTSNRYLSLVHAALLQLLDKNLTHVTNALADIDLPKTYKSVNKQEYKSLSWKLNQLILAACQYQNPVARYQKKQIEQLNIENYHLVSAAELPSSDVIDKLILKNATLAKALKTTKDLANMPPNICNPKYLAAQAQSLASNTNLTCSVYSYEQLVEMGMGSFSSVCQGSENQGCMVVLEYTGAANKTDQPYVLVGKGITFDTGGYTLKPAASMVGMKYDMCGAASVLAIMQTLTELKLPLNVVGILACAENMIGHKSTRPNDIVTTLRGKTVEINNTDAEGRLVLCDAMTYSEKFKPKVVIDIATLTGAAVVALGYQYSAMFTNQEQLKNDLLEAAENSNDLVWPMPLCHDYDDLLRNPYADLQNASSKPVAGSITAACFLANFIPENTPWAHLDIAGTATVFAEHNDATGRPVPLLLNYLLAQANF